MSKKDDSASTNLKLTPVVKSLIGVQITGNITPPNWYKYILKPETPKMKNPKSDLIAISILSDIWYWYTPTEIRDEKTGKTIGYQDKFKADMLQRHYKYYENMFTLGHQQIKRAVDNLIRLKLIQRVVRDIATEDGFMTGVVFLEPIIKTVLKITFPERYRNTNDLPAPPLKFDRVSKKEGGGIKFDTHTKTSTKITKTTTTPLPLSKIPKKLIEAFPSELRIKPILKITAEGLTGKGMPEREPEFIQAEIEWLLKYIETHEVKNLTGLYRTALIEGYGNDAKLLPEVQRSGTQDPQKVINQNLAEQTKLDKQRQIDDAERQHAEDLQALIDGLPSAEYDRLKNIAIDSMSKGDRSLYMRTQSKFTLNRCMRKVYRTWIPACEMIKSMDG